MAALCLHLIIGTSVAASPPTTSRVDATLSGLHRYYYSPPGFYKSCGQNGGLGKSTSSFECECEQGTPYCRNCYRWWMGVTLQSFIALNRAVPHHSSLNTTHALLASMRTHSPYTTRAAPSWAYIDDYVWYVLMWLDAYRWLGIKGDLDEAAATLELMTQWGVDRACGGIDWMYPDTDPRKNSITTLEVIQASAQLGVALKSSAPLRAAEHRHRALSLWSFFESVNLLGDDMLVHDNVTGTAHGKFRCCNATHAPVCEPRDTLTWSYNQGMMLGAMVDMHALTDDKQYLALGAKVLDAVIAKLTREADGDGDSSSIKQTTVLREPDGVTLTLQSRKCDSKHDPSASAGGDLFSFKGVFMQQLPRFLEAASDVLTPTQKAAAKKLVGDSADAAWAARAVPPFSSSDVCDEYPQTEAGAPPKFTWDWRKPPSSFGRKKTLTCMDARTQSQALALFVAEVRLAE